MANVDHSALVIYNCAEKGGMSVALEYSSGIVRTYSGEV